MSEPVRAQEMRLSAAATRNPLSDGQTLASQDAELMAAGCAKVYQEKVSGVRTDRVALAKVMKRIEAGDLLIVTRLDRLARSTRDLLNILHQCREGRQVQVPP
jgi:DNA invertase Pin-like site-specific DNA recombinase